MQRLGIDWRRRSRHLTRLLAGCAGGLLVLCLGGPRLSGTAQALASPLAGPAAPGDGGGRQMVAAADPVVREVVRMLAGSIPEPVIIRWLDKGGKRPAVLASEDLLALKSAGASAELMEKLVELSAAPAPPAESAARPAVDAQPAPAAAPPAPPLPATAPEALPRAAGQPPVPTHFAIDYRPFFGDQDEPWHLFVYLDGRYLASAGPAMVSLARTELVFDRGLAPGPHVLRLAQERHLHRPGGGWKNEARMAPAELTFELRPGGGAVVALAFQQVSLHPSRGPISLRVTQAGNELTRQEPGIPDAKDWPPLCEEVEAGIPPGKEPPVAARRQLARCLRWSALWPRMTGVPTRGEVRAELESLGFRPGPGPAADR